MSNQKTITCAFCQGTGNNPHLSGTCPVCKGKGKNTIVGSFMSCRDCRGTGQKRGTTLTCYSCGGLGMVPDSSKIFKKAKKEIEKAREEMDKEREEFRGKTQLVQASPKPQPKTPPASGGDQPLAGKKPSREEKGKKSKNCQEKIFCQACGNKVQKNSAIKICLKCFQETKNG